MKTLLQRLSYVATFDDEQRELEDADILIDGPRIEAVDRDLSADGADRVVDGRGLIALPGLVNAHQHLFQDTRRSAGASRRREQWLSARELLHMATRGSAACIGRDDLGALAPGMAADLACWDLTGVDRIGVNDPVAALLYTGLSQVAHLVMVNGEIVVEDGSTKRVDPAETAAQARANIPRDIPPPGEVLPTTHEAAAS